MNASEFARLMAGYNRWMNDRLYAVCAEVPKTDRERDLGAFFGSIHNTLDHLVWADDAILVRLQDSDRRVERYQPPQIKDFDPLRERRAEVDDAISEWAAQVRDGDVDQSYEFKSVLYNKTRTLPRYALAAHLFNHQTHHRGQVTALLSRLGYEFGVTDLPWTPGIDAA
ncbi:MAG: DinB family protein [Polyangiales bacterium]